MVNRILAPDVVELGGIPFRLIRFVNRQMLSQWAPKVTSGDTGRDSDPIRSTVGFSDGRGGIGLHIMQGANDTNRMYFSTHDARFERHLIHLPIAIGSESDQFPDQRTIPIPDAVTASISFLETFGNELYVGFGTKIFKWNETSTEWSDELHSLPGTAQSALVTRVGSDQTLYLIVACGDAGYSYTTDGDTWTDVTTQAAEAFVWWDYRLWTITDEGQLTKASGPADSWKNDAWLPLPDESFSSMFTARSQDSTAIHVVSKDGSLWVHDAFNEKFIQTALNLPSHPDTGIGTTVWRDSIYIPSGLAIYEVANQQNRVVRIVGPDRDSGLPRERSGRIIQLLPTPTSLIALVEGENVEGAQIPVMTPLLGAPMVYNSSRRLSTILEWIRGGWHVLWAGGQDGETPTNVVNVLAQGHVTDAYNEYRLFFGLGQQLWYIDLPRYVLNPLQLPERVFTYQAETIYPWFHAGISEAHKVALNILAETRNVTEDITLTVDVGYDYIDDQWYEIKELESDLPDPLFLPRPEDLDDMSLTDAEIEERRKKGIANRAIRFRVRSTLGTNQEISPDLTSLTLEYYKRLGLSQKYQFAINLDLSEGTKNRSSEELIEELDKIVADPELIPFAYRDESFYVKVLSEQRNIPAGLEHEKATSILTLAQI